MNKKFFYFAIFFLLPLGMLLTTSSCEKNRKLRQIITAPQKMGITTREFIDEARQRPVVTEIWYPIEEQVPAKKAPGVWVRCDEARDAPLSTATGKYPLIIFSHGNGGDRLTTAWLAEILAANSYIVAAVDHWGNTWNNKIPELFVRPWERPKDISFVIEKLLQDPLLKDHIDQAKIGFVGYSLGGTTGVWIAGGKACLNENPRAEGTPQLELPKGVTQDVIDKVDFHEANLSYHDPRIRSMLVLAPALARLFDEKSLKKINIPVSIIAPESDRVVPIEQNAKCFAKNITRSKLFIVNGKADHYVFLNQVTVIGRRLIDVSLYNDDPSVDRHEVHETVSKIAVEFFDSTLR
ncbi:MAG TPA: hypothetical protein VJ112_00155 [Rhabdochlamydiaceae bacterium]|nr:hypothetical protein [Rhabdochlamydiaceae bacterium]